MAAPGRAGPLSRRRVLAAVAALLTYAGIFAVSSLPASELPSGIPDVIPHVLEYALLAFFLALAFAPARRLPALLPVLLLALLLGLLDEWHQTTTPGRVFSLLDLLWDGLGAMVGIAAYLGVRARDKRRMDGAL